MNSFHGDWGNKRENSVAWPELHQWLGLSREDLLLVTGSTILPFETATDDFDLLLITADSKLSQWKAYQSLERYQEQESNGFIIAYRKINNFELDIEIWSKNHVLDVIEHSGHGIADIDTIERDFTRFAGLERKVGLDLFHSLLLGKVESQREIDQYRRRIDWERYFSWNRDYHLINAKDAIKGITKSLKQENREEAYLKMCWAADNVVDALIFHSGMSINRWKWRLRYLDFLEKDLAFWYRQIRFAGLPATDAPFQGWLDDLKRFTRTYIGSSPIKRAF